MLLGAELHPINLQCINLNIYMYNAESKKIESLIHLHLYP